MPAESCRGVAVPVSCSPATSFAVSPSLGGIAGIFPFSLEEWQPVKLNPFSSSRSSNFLLISRKDRAAFQQVGGFRRGVAACLPLVSRKCSIFQKATGFPRPLLVEVGSPLEPGLP